MKELYKKNIDSLVIDVIEVIVSILLVLGINFWFHGCANEDMSCHKAEIIIKAISYVLLVLSIVKALIPNKAVKMGMSISNIGISTFMILVPTSLINLCMYESMHCNKYMKPWTIVFGIVFIIISLAEIAYDYLKLKKNK